MRDARFLAVVTIAAGVCLAACTSSTSGSGDAVHSSSSTATSSSAAASSSAASSATSSAPARSGGSSSPAVPLCLSDIRVIPGSVQAAAGHRALVLVFNNVSHTTTCEIIGYPGVDLVTPAGATVAHLTRTLRGMAGGEPSAVSAPQPVVLTPGASASALAEASAVPQGGITDCGDYDLLVTVPNQYVSVSGGTAMLPRCAAEIHPVVAGTSGGLGQH